MRSIWSQRKESTQVPHQKDLAEGSKTSDSSDQPQVMTEADSIPSLILDLLKNRGLVTGEQIQAWLYPKLQDMQDPYLIFGMEKAVQRIAQSFQKNEVICIYADFDLDGTSGLALLKTGLELMGFQHIVSYQPKRLSEGYGFHVSAVEDLHRQDVKLIITVDVGITAQEACLKAHELGIDVIITDHHLPGKELPVAYQIVNPNQSVCQSELEYLCGAGVAFYLLRALKRFFFNSTDLPKNDWDLKEVLDFFTIGTLTDMVPLIGDNRVLVKHGLVKLSQTNKSGLKALLEELDLQDRTLSSQDVAIKFAPKLNALSRMEAGILPIDLFLEKDSKKAQDMVKSVLENNSTRVQLQNQAEQEALMKLKSWSFEDFVFVASENFHRGVVGLIATKLSQTYNKPSFVGSVGKDGVVVGSARMPNGQELCLVEALSSAQSILHRYGGHSAAAGFELHHDHMEDFIGALSGHFKNQKEKPKPLEIFYDLKVELENLSHNLMKWYEFVGPFGAGFPIPMFLINQVGITQKKALKGGHYRMRIVNQAQNYSMEALIFSPSQRQVAVLQSENLQYDVLAELQWNYFNGQKSLQLLIRDLKVHENN